MQEWWSSTSYQTQRRRKHPASADSEFSMISNDKDPGLSFRVTSDPKENILPLMTTLSSPFVKAPRVAILREQGVNGHPEMAFAFKAAGFDPIDVHMTDIIWGVPSRFCTHRRLRRLLLRRCPWRRPRLGVIHPPEQRERTTRIPEIL